LITSDLAKAQAFYDAILAPLGAKRVANYPGISLYGGAKGIFMSIAQKENAAHRDGTHFAFAGSSTQEVDEWYAAGIKAGAKDNGKPGPRPSYGPHFYGAFLHDPIDGTHLECCFKEYQAPSDKPRYKMSYFDGRGRGEQIRLFLHELGVAFEDNRLGRDGFVALQKQENSPLTFGSVPLLEEGKFQVVQGAAIMAYLAKNHGVYPKNSQEAAQADAVVLGAEDFRIKIFNEPTTKAKTSTDGKTDAEKADIDKAQESVKNFLTNTWHGRWAGQFEHILKSNGTGFAVGKSFSHADAAMFDVVDLLHFAMGPLFSGLDDKTPNLAAFYKSIAARPNIKKYIESRK